MGKRRARKELSLLATRLGLTFTPARKKEKIGEITGTYRERDVIINSDFFGSVRGRF